MSDFTPTIQTLAEALGTPPPAQALAPVDRPGSAVAAHRRAQIFALEAALSQHPDAVFGDSDLCPLTHTFADGVYVREIFIPKGTVLTGHIHKYAHPNFLMRGEVIVVTEHGGREHLKAPLSMISPPGTKRAVWALEDTVWITVHVTAERDPARIVELMTVPDYASLAPGSASAAALDRAPDPPACDCCNDYKPAQCSRACGPPQAPQE
jgi:quercetin dioxygenase-like cupin family protein